ncbi:hypothetical protein BD410DRAFT_492975 [Rickenella mellea]|uniref:Uncharacterized protein n=1 Tax=Rickenella mellea TaxID=50990 RepID=A0A4Y7PUK3_9AGAM|nr:hypothetical protein BD410DRAFT_492975 [Rickenella mellea]
MLISVEEFRSTHRRGCICRMTVIGFLIEEMMRCFFRSSERSSCQVDDLITIFQPLFTDERYSVCRCVPMSGKPRWLLGVWVAVSTNGVDIHLCGEMEQRRTTQPQPGTSSVFHLPISIIHIHSIFHTSPTSWFTDIASSYSDFFPVRTDGGSNEEVHSFRTSLLVTNRR